MRKISIGLKIFPDTTEHYELIHRALTAQNVQFFSHAPPAASTFRAICKGLPDIDVELLAEQFEVEQNVKPLSIKKFGRNPESKIYLFEFHKEEMNKEQIRAIKHIDRIIIKWEKYAPKPKGPTQCRRCYMLGHGESYCMRPPICSYCAKQKHPEGIECPNSIVGSDGLPIGPACCLNCTHFGRRSDHSPLDLACPSRIAYERMRAKNNSSNKQQNKKSVNQGRNNHLNPRASHVKENQPRPAFQQNSYADAVRNNGAPNGTHKNDVNQENPAVEAIYYPGNSYSKFSLQR